MDPFSITVGAITLASASRKAIGSIKRLKALRDAPEELQDLLSELSQFEVILQAIEDTAHPSHSVNSSLETLLHEAKKKMVEWDSLVEYRLTQAGSSNKVDRPQWIESQKEIDRLRGQLRDIRASLDVIIGVRTSNTVQNTLEFMRQLHLENQKYHHMATALHHLPRVLEEVQSTGSALNRILANFPHHTLQTSDSDLQSITDETHDSIIQMDRSIAYARSRDQLQLQRTYTVSRCSLDCPCECHNSYFSWASGPLTRIFGRARFESTGPSWIRSAGHIRSCKASAVFRMQIIYFIPRWFAMKAIYIRYTSSPLHCPEWLIRVPRLVDSNNSPAFRSISGEDLPAFKLAMASGECTPYDINEQGRSLLRLILILGRYDILFHLIEKGVDIVRPVVIEDDWLEALWKALVDGYYWFLDRPYNHYITSLSHEILPLQDMIPSFPWLEYKADKGFTLLHDIVCGISGLDLDSATRTHLADINRLDSQGRSPLEYAVHCQDCSAVQTLLRRGADPNVSNGAPVCEFLFSQNAKHVEILKCLLQAGATTDGSAGHRIAEVWISEATWSDSSWDLTVDKLLMEHGVDVNHQKDERTMLMRLCMRRNNKILIKRIEQLISYSANLELRNQGGATALLLAVANQFSMAVKVLIQSGARLDVKSNFGDTIAHLTVIFSRSSDLVRALSEVDLTGLDLDQRNEDGHTAYDLLKKRNGLKWERYVENLELSRFNMCNQDCYCRYRFSWTSRYRAQDEYQIILALEALLHQIQDSQGIPKDQQYPPLGPYLSDDQDEELVPGAWPV